MTGTVADYLDRTVDLLLYEAPTPGAGERETPPALAEGSGEVCAGVQKLAQRFLLTLLTPRGSQRHRAARGTAFMVHASRGFWRTAVDVRQSYAAAASDARKQLRAEETAADPDDERYGADELTRVTLGDGKAAIHVALTSLAGTRRQYVVPVPVAVRR